MATTTDLKLVISAQDKASKVLRDVSGEVNSFATKGMGALKTGAKIAGAAIVAATAAVSAFGVASVKAYGEFNSIQVRMERVLKNTQGATKEQVKVLIDQAQALERVGVVSDTVTMSMQQRLAEYDYEIATIEKLTPALLDMMVAEKGANATTSDAIFYAEGFGKAMQGQFDILRKRGFIITESTEKIMKEGTEAERVNEVYKLLGKTYEGMNKEMRNTPEGAVASLANAWDNVKKSVGLVLVEKLKLVEVFNRLTEQINKIAESDFFAYWEGLRARVIETKIAVENWYREIKKDFEWVFVFIRKSFLPLFNILKKDIQKSFSDIINAVKPFQPLLIATAKVIGGILLVSVVGLIYGLGILIATILKVIAVLSKVVSYLYKNFMKSLEATISMIRNVIDAWGKLRDMISRGIEGTIKVFKKESDSDNRAFGGVVTAGQSYIVGERKPEVFVPSQSGNIKQTSQVGGSISVNFNNVNVRNDGDLQTIVEVVKRTLRSENMYAKYGVRV